VGTREHMGVQVVNADSGGEDLWKGAISDALKKAASLFGVGRELYEDAPVQAPIPMPIQHPGGGMTQQAPQQLRQQHVVDSTSNVSPAQADFITSLGYERGYSYQVIKDTIASLDRGEASKTIDQLRAQQPLRRLERGEKPPQSWYDGTDEAPF
jgi:hypothetical protein